MPWAHTPQLLHHTTSDEQGRFLQDPANHRLAALLRWGGMLGALPPQEATTSSIPVRVTAAVQELEI